MKIVLTSEELLQELNEGHPLLRRIREDGEFTVTEVKLTLGEAVITYGHLSANNAKDAQSVHAKEYSVVPKVESESSAEVPVMRKRRSPVEWSEQDVAYLKENYGKESATSIADALGMPRQKVYDKAWQLGLSGERSASHAARKKLLQQEKDSQVKTSDDPEWDNLPISEKRDRIKAKYTMIDASRDDEYMQKVKRELAGKPKVRIEEDE